MRKPYFSGKVETAHAKHGTFEPGDKIKILPSSPKFPQLTGEIIRLTHSNHGKGRIYAVVKVDGRIGEHSFPIGKCRHN